MYAERITGESGGMQIIFIIYIVSLIGTLFYIAITRETDGERRIL